VERPSEKQGAFPFPERDGAEAVILATGCGVPPRCGELFAIDLKQVVVAVAISGVSLNKTQASLTAQIAETARIASNDSRDRLPASRDILSCVPLRSGQAPRGIPGAAEEWNPFSGILRRAPYQVVLS